MVSGRARVWAGLARVGLACAVVWGTAGALGHQYMPPKVPIRQPDPDMLPPSEPPPTVPTDPRLPTVPLRRDGQRLEFGEVALVNVAGGKPGPARVLVGRGASPALCREPSGTVHAVIVREVEGQAPGEGRRPRDGATAGARATELAIASSTDGGQTWGPVRPLRVESAPGELGAGAGPVLVAVPDGGLRLFYSAGRVVDGQATGVAAVYSAVSRDGGKSFVHEAGTRLMLAEGASDVAVARMGETWFMGVPRASGGMTVATSGDGLAFAKVGEASGLAMSEQPWRGVWRGAMLSADGTLTFIGSGVGPEASQRAKVWTATSGDGKVWKVGAAFRIEGDDVAAAMLPGGEVLLAVVRRGGASGPERELPSVPRQREPAPVVPPTTPRPNEPVPILPPREPLPR